MFVGVVVRVSGGSECEYNHLLLDIEEIVEFLFYLSFWIDS